MRRGGRRYEEEGVHLWWSMHWGGESLHKSADSVLLFDHHHWWGPRTVGRTNDAAGQHLLDLRHFFPSHSGVLPLIRLTEGWSICFNSMLQQRSTAKVIFPLADNVAELFEMVLQLLLLYGRQMFRYGWLAHRLGRGGRWLRNQRRQPPPKCPHSDPSAGGIATHTENPMQVAEAPVSTRPRTGMPSRLSWPVMGGPTEHTTGVTLASGDLSNRFSCTWGPGWESSLAVGGFRIGPRGGSWGLASAYCRRRRWREGRAGQLAATCPSSSQRKQRGGRWSIWRQGRRGWFILSP